MSRFYITILWLLAIPLLAQAQDKKTSLPTQGDTTVVNRIVDPIPPNAPQNAERFYDSLETKASRGGMLSLIYKTLFKRPRRDTTKVGEIIDEIGHYSRYEGKTIADIQIDRHRIYEGDNLSWTKHAINATHRKTRVYVVKRDLYFKTGDKVDAYEIALNKNLLMSRDYLASVDIDLRIREDDTTRVDVFIRTDDKMTLALDGSWRSRGRTMVEVYDESFLGSGDKVALRTHFNRRTWKYQGNSMRYHSPNILGSFYKADLRVGREFYDDLLRVSVYKDFMLPSDYDVGVSYKNDRLEYVSIYDNATDSIREKKIMAWAGKSFHIRPLRSSIYLTGMYGHTEYGRRPEVRPDFNPYFHESEYMFFGLGLFREKFYRANMIYGYGRREHIAEGYNLELVGGYSWGEFRDEYYAGFKFRKGKFVSWGFIRGDFEIGSYIGHDDGKLRRSALDFNLQWFSPLLRLRNNNVREFISIRHTRGWNRAEGDQELLQFTDDDGPRTIDKWITGRNRFIINTESVLFTPYQPWGFRLAAFMFYDLGLIGNDTNIFENAFYNTIGCGIRLKNERFVFNTIEIRVGVALNKRGFMSNEYFRLSSEQKLHRTRFIPDYPNPVEYK